MIRAADPEQQRAIGVVEVFSPDGLCAGDELERRTWHGRSGDAGPAAPERDGACEILGNVSEAYRRHRISRSQL